jgi:hypothetical protein
MMITNLLKVKRRAKVAMEGWKMESRTIYFEKPGEVNTDAVLAIAKQRAGDLDIKKIIVASSRGVTAVKALAVFDGLKVIVVGHEYGHIEPNTTDFLEENRRIVESKGATILAGIHGFGGIDNAFRPRPPGFRPGAPGAPAGGPPPGMPAPLPIPGEIIARTLSVFGRGMKVAAEITIMAADAGLVRTDEEVIAIAGSSRGADIAVVIQPANANRFFELRIKEILCKPRT